MMDMDEEKSKKKIVPIVIVAACVLALVLTQLVIKKAPAKGGMPGGPGGPGMMGKGKGGFGAGPQETTVTVRTRAAAENILHAYVNTNGEIESKSQIAVFPDIGGKVYNNFVGLGTVVKKGDVIAEIDPSEPGAYFTHSKVFAPVSGTIVATVLEPGTKVSTQSVITTIGDVANLQLKVKIVERYVADIKPGLKAKVKLEAYPDEVFDATVAKVSPVLDQTSRTKEVILDFDKKDTRINAGMFAKVTLYTVDYKGKVTVPMSCVVTKGSHNYVFVVDEGGDRARKVEVILGRSVDDEVQVDGIEAGTKVVVEGMSVLTDGSKVRDISK